MFKTYLQHDYSFKVKYDITSFIVSPRQASTSIWIISLIFELKLLFLEQGDNFKVDFKTVLM